MNFPWETIKKSVNARIYLMFGFTQSLWFIEAVWYFYWAKFMTYSEIGIVFSFLVVIGLLAEIPTGMIADKFGRKNSVLFGVFLLSVGGGFMTSATLSSVLIIGVTLMSIGRAFISGSLEAIVYDDLKSVGLQESWDKLVSTKFQLSLLAYVLAVPIGGYLYQIYFRAPNLLETTTMIVSFFIALQLKENRVIPSTNHKLVGINWRELIIGFKQLWNINIRPYLIPSFLIITVFELYDWGLSKPAMAVNFGLDSLAQSIVFTAMALVNILVIGQMPRLRKVLGDYWGLRLLNIVSGTAFIISTYIFSYWGIGTMLLLEISGNLGDPWTSSVVNKYLDSRYRATTLSTLAFLTRIPHFFVNILAGSALDGAGINTFHFCLGMLIIFFTLLTFFAPKPSLLTRKA